MVRFCCLPMTGTTRYYAPVCRVASFLKAWRLFLRIGLSFPVIAMTRTWHFICVLINLFVSNKVVALQ